MSEPRKPDETSQEPAETSVDGVSIVSLLVAELAYGPGTPLDDQAKVGILAGTLLSALLAAVVLRLRNRRYRRIEEAERRDADGDGVPDLYQSGTLGG